MSGRDVRVCGDACRIATRTIANAGLDAWYELRTHPDAQGATTADPRHRAELDAWRVPEVEASLLRRGGDDGDGHAETGREPGNRTPGASPPSGAAHAETGREPGDRTVTLTVEGMRCAGCAWLVERLLASVPGVAATSVDFPLRRASVRFDTRATRLHTLLETLARAGYRAAPYTVHAEEAAIESERRARIRGLGISALFGMQVMLLSIALYASGDGGMDPGLEQLFRWLAMGLTVPVLAWPGRAFFTGAAAALRARRLTMDVPVALGLSIAFAGSAFATVSGEGEIWFDSVVMFVTLLGAARYLELLARRRTSAAIRALARSAPLVAARVREGRARGDVDRTDESRDDENRDNEGRDNEGRSDEGRSDEGRGEEIDRIPAAALRPGDRVRVRPGEVVPADGAIRSGRSAFDESLLTGESNPVARSAGSRVLAGSVNGAGTVEVEVSRAGDATVLGGVLRQAEQAARARPAIAQLADRAAAWFIGAVLVLAAGVAIGWLVHDPARMVPVLVSVLVVTCPCALSLATPAAMTAALGALARAGLVATRANAVERLALATHCLADKTGTLTEGRFRLRSVTTFTGLSRSRCLALAATLERYATHPAADALVAAAEGAGGEERAPGRTEELRAPCPMVRRDRGTSGRTEELRTETDPSAGTGTGEPHAIGRVEAPATRTGGVTGRIDGVRHAVGSPEFVARACGLDPGESGAAATGGDATAPSSRDKAPETADPAEPAADAGADTDADTGAGAGADADADTAADAGDDAVADDGADTGADADADADAGADADADAGAGAPGPGLSGAFADADGGTCVFLAREGALLARFVLADTLRADAGELVRGLRRRGIETTIASGDSIAAVERAARELGVARRCAGLSPEDKLAEADRLAASGERVLMLGDGVNDAPALAGAHVSVAMGRGAAAAAARADAVLIGDDPGRLLAALDIARRARRIVKQNFAWALGYNLVALPLAATGAVPPWAAAIGMSLSSLAVAANALRLARGPAPAAG